jgi:hypothetical protein
VGSDPRAPKGPPPGPGGRLTSDHGNRRPPAGWRGRGRAGRGWLPASPEGQPRPRAVLETTQQRWSSTSTNVPDEQVGLFHGGEVPAPVELRPAPPRRSLTRSSIDGLSSEESGARSSNRTSICALAARGPLFTGGRARSRIVQRFARGRLSAPPGLPAVEPQRRVGTQCGLHDDRHVLERNGKTFPDAVDRGSRARRYATLSRTTCPGCWKASRVL